MENIKHNLLLFWDIDGTLMSCGSDGSKALNKTFQDLYGIRDAFQNAGIGKATDCAILRRIMAQYRLDCADYDAIVSVYLTNLQNILDGDQDIQVLPGVRELLAYAKKSGICLALLTTNLRIGAECKLRAAGLLCDSDGMPYFVDGGFGDTIEDKWESARAAQKRISEKLGRHFQKGIVIGDSLYDIETAKKCGYHMIATATGWTSFSELAAGTPDLLVSSLDATHAVIDFIEQVRQST